MALPAFSIPDTESDETLGAAVRAAEDASGVHEGPRDKWGVIADESVITELTEAVFDSLGMKDRQTLERGAKLVDVERTEDAWELSPMRRVRGGWLRTVEDEEHEMTRTVTLPAASRDEELGAALKAALAGPTPTG